MVSVKRGAHEGEFPHFSAPTHVGQFSVNKSGQMVDDASQLRRLYSQPLETGGRQMALDLSEGFAQFESKDELAQDGKLDTFLDWIRLHGEKTSLKKSVYDADFVCWRGTLTRIAASPYEDREGWRMIAMRVDDVIFICEMKTPEKRLAIENESRRQKLMCYWGFKFEQYMTLPHERVSANGRAMRLQEEPDTSEPVNNMEQFCTVVRSRLGKHRLLFAGETDCRESSSKHFVELKTQHELNSAKQKENFWRFKSLKWWLQSFLVGIEKIIVGYRDDEGFVRSIRPLAVRELLSNAREYWHGNVAFNFLNSVLSYLAETLRANESHVLFVLDWRPAWQNVTLKRVESAKRAEFDFIPASFLQFYRQE